MWDKIQKEFFTRYGWKIDENEILVLTMDQFKKYQYAGKSIYNPKIKTLMIPGKKGSTLIFENKHFKII